VVVVVMELLTHHLIQMAQPLEVLEVVVTAQGRLALLVKVLQAAMVATTLLHITQAVVAVVRVL
jgi:hypothetical protein